MDDRCELLCLDLEVAEALRGSRLDPAHAELVSQRAHALADPTRLQLVAALGAANELCVCDLAWIAERSQNLVSHHLKILRRAELVRSRRAGKMVIYALTDQGRALLEAVVASALEIEA
jgi:ArsR family transcriptional regulator, lead/cadmium/zinc/bismuth-responsive transcriptional repressor